MMNNKKTTLVIATALMFSASAAFADADSSVVVKQTSFLQKLDSLNKAILGLRLGGTAKAGGAISQVHSNQLADYSATKENELYTDVNLKFLAQPSSETRLDVQVRLHKDWQSAMDENNNPVIGHWFSYDGKILNNHVDFNLGYMRIGYSPLTINTPQIEILQEPEIFRQNRVEALSYRNLDTTSRRLMQGLNAEFHSGAVGVVDDIYAQATGARMRNTAKKNDQVFFDFDWADRYAYGLRFGASTFGFNLGANYVGAFDRRLSTRSRDMGLKDTIFYDNNSVFSAEFGFNSKKLLSDLPISFGLNAEYAMSWWDVDIETKDDSPTFNTQIKEYTGFPSGDLTTTLVYVSNTVDLTGVERVTKDFLDDKGNALNIKPYVEGSFSKFNFKVNGMYLMNDKEFWSELASSPNYTNNGIIFNANALYGDADNALISNFASGNLENLYFMVYNTDLLTAATLMTSSSKTVLSGNSEAREMYFRLYNNYKLAHFYRNGYDANTMKKLEAAQAVLLMDPSVNLALPYGVATPDRKGFAASLDADWDDAVKLNVRFSQYTAEADENKFTTIGAGVGVDLGRLIPSLERKLELSASFEKASESSFLKRSSQRVVAGASADIWGPIGLQLGLQKLNKEFEALPVGTAFVQKVDELLIFVGPKFRIAPESYVTVRYGMLNNSVDYLTTDATGIVKKNLSVDKNLITADVTVNF
ncbi:MAG: hypothetical protein IK012_05925 [Fibrobacter sp.]|uniref:hypothetical protein n=1 Tax=Fibrobacter sp. TaxID=35828 RepID=UPI0025C45B1B|nr:hypothetical protein [Fibrobacter sp.]MBR4784777.1 hypothetical protein [Fibrobacter sp.]